MIRSLSPFSMFCKIILISSSAHALNTGISRETVESWKQEYLSISEQLSHEIGLSRTRQSEDRHEANRQSLLLSTDKTALGVILRRTEALLSRIEQMTPARGRSSDFRARLENLRTRATGGGLAKRSVSAEQALFLEVGALRREIALSNPLIDFDEILFTIEPHRFASGFGIVIQQLHNSTSGNGGIYIVKGIKSGAKTVRSVLPDAVGDGKYKGVSWRLGGFNTVSLDFDARSIVFAWQFPNHTIYHTFPGGSSPGGSSLDLYRINLDGTGCRQLTNNDFHESHACFLPGGRIAYVAEWPEGVGYARCDPNWHNEQKTATLHSCKGDGSDQIRLSWHETNELWPSVDSDGKLVYTRWDYIDRDFNVAHHIWTCFPDGRDPRAPHGNYPFPLSTVSSKPPSSPNRASRPWAELYIRPIPGSPRKYSAIATSHHHSGKGPVIIIDTQVPDDNAMAQVKRVNPNVAIPTDGENSQLPGCYQTPWPLSEEFFLVADPGLPGGGEIAPPPTTVAGIYLIDVFGNKELLHASDPAIRKTGEKNGMAIYYPIPVRKQTTPPQLATGTWQGERRNRADHKRAAISVMNVYESDFKWPAGTKIKSLRIIQTLAKPWLGSRPNKDTLYSMHRDKPVIGYSMGAIPRMVLGSVPVEEDGSAYFEAPVECEIYFQAIDERGLAIQSMRSGTNVHPGENLSCLGCHENKWSAPQPRTEVPMAFRRSPSKITPDVDGSCPLTFARLALPILEKRCDQCHAQGTGPRFTRQRVPPFHDAENAGHLSNAAYVNLQPYAFYFHAEGANLLMEAKHGGSRSEAGKFGALASPLFLKLGSSHHGVQLTPEEFHRITLWLDCNSLELGSYSYRKTDIEKQLNGEVVWPEFEVDSANPTRVENTRPAMVSPVALWHDGNRSQDQPFPRIRVSIDGRSLRYGGASAAGTAVRLFDLRGRQGQSRRIEPDMQEIRIPIDRAAASSQTLFVIGSSGNAQTIKRVQIVR